MDRPGPEGGETVFYVSFQDNVDQLVEMSTVFGWDLAAPIASGQLVIFHVPMGNLDLDVLASTIQAEVVQHQDGRVVIDSLAEMVTANREAERFPAYKRSLIGLIRSAGDSVLITNESPLRENDTSSGLNVLMFLFDNVINLRYIEDEGPDIGRAIGIVKMRNSDHAKTLNRVTIDERGIAVGNTILGASGRLGWSVLTSRSSWHNVTLSPPALARLYQLLSGPELPSVDRLRKPWGCPVGRQSGGRGLDGQNSRGR